MGTRNNFSEIYPQFGNEPSKSFANPVLSWKSLMNISPKGREVIVCSRRTWSRDWSKRQRYLCVATIRLQFEFRLFLVVSVDYQSYFMLVSVKYNLAYRCNRHCEVTLTSWCSRSQGQQTAVPGVRKPEQILSCVCLAYDLWRATRFPSPEGGSPSRWKYYVTLWWCIRPSWDTKYASLEI
jgi:hypothetical protein